MAGAITVSILGWVASPIVSKLLNEGFSYLGDTGIKDRLENLETTILPQFQFVIEAVERSNIGEHKTKLKLWLRKLKEAMYEAEDTLDLYKYQLLEKKVNNLNSASTSKALGKFVGNWKKGLSSTFPPQNKKLKDSLIKLEKIAVEAKSFYELFLGVGSGINIPNNTTIEGHVDVTTSIPSAKVFGRDKDRDEIIENYLLNPSEALESETCAGMKRSYSVIAIVGIGGAGKTTLAQFVYDDKRVDKNFNIKIWVCLSRKLDKFKLTKLMIESASKKECPCLEGFDTLQNTLTDLIKSKKVLLVLDDIWCYKSENEMEWEQILAPLNLGERGSKILITTRPENMPNMPLVLRSQTRVELKDLGEDEYVSLFRHYAFYWTKLNDPHLQEELEKIGNQILQKLSRSPLAAKTLGCQLSKNIDIKFWKTILEQDNLKDTQKVLIWSYQRLDAHLQRCFSYFSLFPKGHRFKAAEMVFLWMAEGFISSNDSRRMEDIGKDYFDELVSGSFLQFIEQDRHGDEYYNMHDLFHDLAEKVSEEDCFRIEDDQVKEMPLTIRHLGVWCNSTRKGSTDFAKLGNLRTLLVSVQLSNNDNNILMKAVEKFEKLRVLKIHSLGTKALPKYIGDLKHLRYLNLTWSSDVTELLVSLGKLHHLQILVLPFQADRRLPRSLNNLSNLRHCLGTSSANLSTLPDLGKLTSFQRLEYFYVKKEKEYDIGQLKNLNELRGLLTISNLENVQGKEQAIGANLKDKKYLDSLCLRWDVCQNFDMEVVEGLRPPPNLTRLEIDGCKSLRCPTWLIQEGCLDNLRSLSLNHSSFEDLSIISRSFPRCQELEIGSLSNLRTFPLLPQSLEKLEISYCPLLVFVSEEELQNSAERKQSIMAIVQSSQLKVWRDSLAREYLDVKKLMESEKVDIPEDFHTFVTNLQSEEMTMQVDRIWEAYCCCQEQRLAAIFARQNQSELFLPSALQYLEIVSINITDGALSLCLGQLTSLKSLSLEEIRTITIVPIDHLMSLCYLKILDCPCLKSLGSLHALRSLKKISIYSCPCLELEMSGSHGRVILPHSLLSFSVGNSTNVKTVAIGDLPDLIDLSLSELPLLASLSLSGLTALKKLMISNCPELSALDCSEALNISFGFVSIEDVPKLASASLPKAVHFLSFDELSIDSDATLGLLLSGGSECLAALRRLHLDSCPEASFHEEHFNSLTSLEELKLDDCKVQSLPRSLKNLSSLKTLCLNRCPHISSLSSNLPESLKELRLLRCNGILALSDLPNSLHELTLYDCAGISSLPMRCREAKGEDWSKIAHIPIRDIN